MTKTNEITVARARKIEAAAERERVRLATLRAEFVATHGERVSPFSWRA